MIQGRWLVFLLWACFVTRGLFYCLVLPLWEGFDEYAHFAYTQRVAVAVGRLVRPETRASREVERSIMLLPMPWMLRMQSPPHETYESWWRLPAEQRRNRERELAALPISLGAQDSVSPLPVESQQPPLSYWLMAPAYAMLVGFGLATRVMALRILNVLLASFAVPAAWMAGRRVFGSFPEARPEYRRTDGVAAAIAALVALSPEVMFDAARVANSGLTIALFSATAVLCLDVVDGRRRATWWLGAALGLGLLTKAFFLTAIPAAAVVLAWAVWKGRTRIRSAAAALLLAAVISAWWYARNLRITGSFSGLIQDSALRHMPLVERLRHVAEVNWLAAIDSTFFTHIWLGGWSFLGLRSWIYRFFAILAVLAAAGLAVAWARRIPARSRLFALATLYVFFCAGLAYHVLLTFLANQSSSSAGWYLCAIVVPEIVLTAIGLRALAPARVTVYVIGGVASAFALLDLYGMLFVALPYYTGLIGHKPGGSLEAFHFARLAETGLDEVVRRISTNKPAVFGPVLVLVAGFAYISATLTLAAVALVAEKCQSRAGD
jgi:hypothetical protein